MLYRVLIRPLLFLFPAEKAHKIALRALKVLRYIPGAKFIVRLFCKRRSKSLQKELFGINFPNPVGLAAGLDKNGEFYNDLANLGFGFLEIGSLTPQPQPGNPAPRLWRLPKDNALINRMGINNNGVRFALQNLKKNHPNIVIGANLSKNADTENEDAPKDFSRCIALLYDFVDFFTLNVSCPNVQGLQHLQDINMLQSVIDAVNEVRRYNEYSRPVLLKVSPDLDHKQLDEIIHICLINGIDGVVATNTTLSREGLITPEKAVEAIGNGGLSGAPLYKKSLETVKYIKQQSSGLLPIIAVGGIMTPQQAEEMLNAGADLIEVYTGFIYNGPMFVKRIVKYLKKKKK